MAFSPPYDFPGERKLIGNRKSLRGEVVNSLAAALTLERENGRFSFSTSSLRTTPFLLFALSTVFFCQPLWRAENLSGQKSGLYVAARHVANKGQGSPQPSEPSEPSQRGFMMALLRRVATRKGRMAKSVASSARNDSRLDSTKEREERKECLRRRRVIRNSDSANNAPRANERDV